MSPPPLLLSLGLSLLLAEIPTAHGLQCYVCNSRSDPRCADPIQVAEESEDQNGDNYNNYNNKNSNNINNNNNNHNNNYNNNNNNFYNNDENEGLRPVDCLVSSRVGQAMEVVGGLLHRLGQRPPSQGAGAEVVRWGASPEAPDEVACHKVDMEVDGELVTDRGCAPSQVAGMEPCETLSETMGDLLFCELCDEDQCNAGRPARPSSSSCLAPTLLAIAWAWA